MSPTYEICYFMECLLSFTSCLAYISFVNMFVSFIVFGFALLQILHRKFEGIAGEFSEAKGPRNDLIAQRFRLYIEYHSRIIDYVSGMNEIFSISCLVEILIFGIVLSTLLFQLVIVNKTSQLCLVAGCICLILMQLFVIYWISNEMIEQVSERRRR